MKRADISAGREGPASRSSTEHRGAERWAHPTDMHPIAEGHRIAAEAMAEFLLANAKTLRLDEPR